MRQIQILGICGSLRKNSYNLMALRAATQLMPSGMQLEEASIADIPLYSQDIEDCGIPPAVQQLHHQILAADAVLIASPEYNFSVSGVLKNTIDWLSRVTPQHAWKDKPVALFSATQGPVGGARSQYEVRKSLGCLEALVLLKPETFINLAHTKFDAQGQLIDELTRKFLGEQMIAFERWIRRFVA